MKEKVMKSVDYLMTNQILPRIGGQMPETDECVYWPGATVSNGYGVVNAGIYVHNNLPANAYVHQTTCEFYHGPRPAPELVALHSCDEPSCFNPQHLRWDTRSANAHDMWNRERAVRFPEEKVNGIRADLEDGMLQKDVAAKWNYTQTYVSSLRTGRTELLPRIEISNPRNREREFCRKGHPLSGENLYISPKSRKRLCQICLKARNHASYLRKKQLRKTSELNRPLETIN